MTRRAQGLGLRQTRFREPTGLSPENVSTPREAIALLRAAIAHPVLGPITRRVEYDAHPVARPPVKYVTTHRPAARANTQVAGGKTGYNDAARYCLVLAARVGGRNVGMALLGAEGKMTRFGDVARVSDWIVLHRARKEPVGGAATVVAASPGAGPPPPGTPTPTPPPPGTPAPTAPPSPGPPVGSPAGAAGAAASPAAAAPAAGNPAPGAGVAGPAAGAAAQPPAAAPTPPVGSAKL
jgi:D-alanyl-D-alanine carboxypeptidase